MDHALDHHHTAAIQKHMVLVAITTSAMWLARPWRSEPRSTVQGTERVWVRHHTAATLQNGVLVATTIEKAD